MGWFHDLTIISGLVIGVLVIGVLVIMLLHTVLSLQCVNFSMRCFANEKTI